MNAFHHAESSVTAALAWAPHWIVAIAVLVGSALIALGLYWWVLRLFMRVAGRFGTFPQTFVSYARGPVAAILLDAVLGAALPTAGLSLALTLALGHVLLIAFVLAVGWAAFNALDLGSIVYLRGYHTNVPDNLLARKHVTQVNILKRASQTLIVVLTVSGALMTIPSVRQYGVSLFASAGAAGLVVGLAARPLFSNLIAGVQLALTQPIRLEDAVVVEGEWGWIEEITSTYVVIRIWDLRRLVVPLTYFIEKPFQNWTRKSADLLGSVMLNVDYTVPVERIREQLKQILDGHRLWDGKVAVVQVTDTPNYMVQLRVLVSARNSGQAWDLRCDVREKLIAFLQAEYPHALPRQRAEFVTDSGWPGPFTGASRQQQPSVHDRADAGAGSGQAGAPARATHDVVAQG